MMLNFKEIELSDRDWVNSILKISDYRGTEYSFASNFIWSKMIDARIARFDDYYLVKSHPEKPRYVYPAGRGDFKAMMEALMEDAAQGGSPFYMYAVSPQGREEIERLFPGRFEWKEDRDYFDYVYNALDLTELKGKKYHGKRNHISKFLSSYPDWQYEEIGPDNLEDCVRMNKIWCEQNDCGQDEGKKEEMCATKRALKYFFDLDFKGGLIRAAGKVVAYSIGEQINSDTLLVHIEKAFADIQGSYPLINREFARHNAADLKYINREDDSGVEGLRKAKLSYNPAFLIEKYILTEKE